MDNNDIKLIQLGSYVRPDVKEYYGRKWVLNGEKNSYPQYVIDRRIGSPTNGSILEIFSELLYGKGLSVNGSDEVYEELAEIFPKREQRKCLDDFETFGYYFMQILKGKGADKIAKILHLPVDKIGRDKMDENGDINGAWYCEDWSNTYKYKPKYIPEFKGKMTEPLMVKSVVPYQQGQDYFSLPNYVQGLQYAEMEEEISNYCINHIKNGLSFGYIINFNNGGNLTPEQKNEVEKMIKNKLTGSSNAGKFILSFNDSKEAEVTVVPLEINDAHSQWEFLTNEARQQIFTAHGAYPNLFGIDSGNGFSNNADELDVSSKMLQDYKISPVQSYFIDELAELLELNGLETDLVFIPLRDTYKSTEETPEAEVVDEVVDENELEQEDVRMADHVCLSDDNEATIELADHLISFGEELDEKEWYLLAENEVDYETDDLIYESIQFATSTGVARPNAKSEQDSEDIVIRYRYVGNKLPERDFCRKMMFANKLYRKEDIQQMDRSGINDGFGLGGTNSYSIWLWKGGGKMSTAFPNGTCKHKWNREIYLKRGGGVDVNSPLAKKISTTAARKKGYKVPVNDSDVSIAPHSNK